MPLTNTRAGCISKAQKQLLLNYIKANPQLNNGKFTPTFTKKCAQKMWKEITVTLNNVLGAPTKEWFQWRKAWQDLKKNAKAKIRQRKRLANGTGDNPSKGDILSQLKVEIFETMPESSVLPSFECIKEENVPFSDHNDQPEVILPPLMTPPPAVIQLIQLPPAAPSTSAEVQLSPQEVTQQPIKQKKSVTESSRLESSINLTKDFLNATKERGQLLDDYHARKLQLMREDLEHRKDYRRKKLALLEASVAATNDLVRALSNRNENGKK